MSIPFDLFTFASFAGDDDVGASPSGERSHGRGRQTTTIVLSPSLIERVQTQDVDAFREMVRLTYAPLVRFARSIVGTLDDAEDVVQDVFTVIWDLGTRWTPSGDPVAYLFASVRNHALNEVRRRNRADQRALQSQLLDTHVPTTAVAETPDPLDEVVDAETHTARIQRVTAVLSTLPERQRTAYELRFRRGLAIAAIAEVLETTVKSAEHLVARATRAVLERLRAETTPD